jgi:hypothetical protein
MVKALSSNLSTTKKKKKARHPDTKNDYQWKQPARQSPGTVFTHQLLQSSGRYHLVSSSFTRKLTKQSIL